jgi:hypothetical protein
MYKTESKLLVLTQEQKALRSISDRNLEKRETPKRQKFHNLIFFSYRHDKEGYIIQVT